MFPNHIFIFVKNKELVGMHILGRQDEEDYMLCFDDASKVLYCT